ncbi:hypothetical protein M0R45_008113 [Rubus argutus]|uniref:Uncharacterized protein n=1 Tax=Rubus argutus TaxID=59490 RepID=A0AAW1Y092_RUBAR
MHKLHQSIRLLMPTTDCLPEIRIAKAVNATVIAEKAFFQAWKALATFLHSLQWATCLKYPLAKFRACMAPMPPLAGKDAETPATSTAGACSGILVPNLYCYFVMAIEFF